MANGECPPYALASPPDPFIFFMLLAVHRLSYALKPTIRHEQHEVRRGGFLLLAAVQPPYSQQFQGIQSLCDNLDAHV